MLACILDRMSSVLPRELWSFPLGSGLIWEASIAEPLPFLFYVIGVDHRLLFLVTAFLKSPASRHFCSYMSRIVCWRSESKTPELSDLCRCKSYCVTFPCAVQDLYYCLYFSSSCFLLDSQQSSFWSIKITSLLPILSVWSHYLSFWSSSLPFFLFPPWNHTSGSRCIIFPLHSSSLF